jgi:hypothetical protein
MQRNFINKEYLKYIYLFIFLIYDSISTLNILFPAMIGMLSIFFYKALKSNDTYYIASFVFVLLIFESNRDLLLFSTSLFFTMSYYYIVPHLSNITNCIKCLETIFIIFAYFGYIIFSVILSYLFEAQFISTDIFIIIYYILLEITIMLALI